MSLSSTGLRRTRLSVSYKKYPITNDMNRSDHVVSTGSISTHPAETRPRVLIIVTAYPTNT